MNINQRSRRAFAKLHGLKAFFMELKVAASKYAATLRTDPTPVTELPDHGREFYFPPTPVVFTIKNEKPTPEMQALLKKVVFLPPAGTLCAKALEISAEIKKYGGD